MTVTVMTNEELAALVPDRDAGFGALETPRGPLPLVAMDVDVRVTGVVAAIELAQRFANTTGSPIEATYIFPLPDRAAVHRFRMEVAGRVIEGVVDERAAAREQYDRAIAAGHRAAITEEERAGVFTLRVGNLMPGEVATVRLSLVGPLPVDDGEVTFRFPLVVAPRYIPGAQLGGEQAGLGIAADTDLVPDASRISPPVWLPGCPNPVRLSIGVAFAGGVPAAFASSLHQVTSDAKRVALANAERLDRDFILRWRASGPELASTLACVDDADGKAGTFALSLVPPSARDVAAKPRDVVFVIDRSGSMGGWKMVAARRAAARMIDSLASRDRFATIAFDNVVELVPAKGLVDATDRERFRAVEALAKVDARGGTELLQPLERAVDLLAGGYDDRERTIVLVTDGQVGNEDHILRAIAPKLKKTRVFSLGIDQAVNAAFLRRLASAGGGLCELVESEDRLDAVMAKVHRRIGAPIATELAITATGLDLDRDAIAPARLPDVYAGAPVVIFGRYRGKAAANATIEVVGTSFGEPLKQAVAHGRDGIEGNWLAASWARATIRDLEDRYAATTSPELERRIVAVSKQFGVLSRFTAFVAIDRAEVANKGGRIAQVAQPVDAPAGWDTRAGHGGQRVNMPMGAPMAMPGGMPFPPTMPPPPAPPMGAPPPITLAGAPPPQAMAKSVMLGAPAPMQAGAMPPGAMPTPSDVQQELPPADASSYLERLAELARDLAAALRGGANRHALLALAQRLDEWIEDARSVGHDALADEVAERAKRLRAAISGGRAASDGVAIADELAELATQPPPPPKKKSRLAFWK
jgi:Ca-activated chloride channel family protein